MSIVKVKDGQSTPTKFEELKRGDKFRYAVCEGRAPGDIYMALSDGRKNENGKGGVLCCKVNDMPDEYDAYDVEDTAGMYSINEIDMN